MIYPSACLEPIWFLIPINLHTLMRWMFLSSADIMMGCSKTSGLWAAYRMKSRLLWLRISTTSLTCPSVWSNTLNSPFHFRNMSSLVSKQPVVWSQGTKIQWNHLFFKKKDLSKGCKSILWTPKAGIKARPHEKWEITWQLLCVSPWEPHYFKSESWPCPKLTEWQPAHMQDAQVMHSFFFWEMPNW